MTISRIRAGELGGGSLALRGLFSWPAAVFGVIIALVLAVLLKLRPPQWVRNRRGQQDQAGVARPSVAFYAETLDQIARAGVHRGRSQTPAELARDASTQLEHPMVPSIAGPLHLLTNAFYRLRFGHAGAIGGESVSDKNGSEVASGGPVEHARQRSPEIDRALTELTRSVDLMTVNSKASERTS